MGEVGGVDVAEETGFVVVNDGITMLVGDGLTVAVADGATAMVGDGDTVAVDLQAVRDMPQLTPTTINGITQSRDNQYFNDNI